MALWGDIRDLLAGNRNGAFAAVVERVKRAFVGDPQTRRRVAFSVALIALSAKMAKADGVVSPAEVDAFREVFDVPDAEMANVARLYNLAKQDVAGAEAYAARVRTLFPGTSEGDEAVLADVLDALFHIAKADGVLHHDELAFLEGVGMAFGFDQARFDGIRRRHGDEDGTNPYVVLEADPSWSFERLRAQYRKLAATCHPDRMIARGVPAEFIKLSNDRLAELNDAWAIIESRHKLHRARPADVMA